MPHGSPTSTARHVGDLGNILSIDCDEATMIFIEDGAPENAISLQNNSNSNILNRTIVIHEKADNFTGSSGFAGARIACGIIVESTFDDFGKVIINYIPIYK